jgi:hypothetical protein
MRLLPFLLAGLALGFALAAGSGTTVQAIEYPWCAEFADGAGSNCGFLTYDQCMQTARGTGGYCAKNVFYEQAATTAPRHRPPRTRHPPEKN